ncbi:hypothetical protein J2W14_003838 [Pseudarthrobacter oxydans]|uniref:hypothetical protein n=1 Tax=Pseudarthrobacter oxydans TaxID=1671 RepID=UPI00278ADBDA|nr:hypothetical protein [Pseudarthrobacter oxydans]MDP9984413.1 hypothetical protein [Pseudarthrobacter oxydans]
MSSPARQPSHEGCLPQSGPFNAFNRVNLHTGVHYTGVLERGGYGSPHPLGGGSGSEARDEDPQPGRLLDDLPPRSRG